MLDDLAGINDQAQRRSARVGLLTLLAGATAATSGAVGQSGPVPPGARTPWRGCLTFRVRCHRRRLGCSRTVSATGANASSNVLALNGGMIAGADSISAHGQLLRHGGTTRLFTDVRAPRRPGRSYAGSPFVHLLDAVVAGLLARLAVATAILPRDDQVVFVDLDDTVRQTDGYANRAPGAASPASTG